MVINPNLASIKYQAMTELLGSTTEATRTRDRQKRKVLYAKAAKIRYYLNALNQYPTYIDAEKANQILQCLIIVSGIQDYPVAPPTAALSNPVSSVAIVGPPGTQGQRGNDGGATDFVAVDVNSTRVVDSFPLASAYAARWDYIVNGTAQRAGTIYATWTEDGANVDFTEIGTNDINGSTSDVAFTVSIVGTTVQLNAVITGGLWEIRGSRYFIPNQGIGVNVSSTPLPNGQIFIGNSSNAATANAVTGDISITNTGVTSIVADTIVNADINSTANIAVSKLASLSDNNAVVLTNGSGKITSIANGTAGFVLTSNGTSAPTWQAVAGTGTVTSVSGAGGTTGLTLSGGPISTIGTLTLGGTLSYAHGGTDQTFYAQGDILFASAANTLAKRAIGTSGQVLTVSGGVPVWSSSINTDNVNLRTKKLDIGPWLMPLNPTVSVAHGLTAANIRSVSVIIVDDTATNYYEINHYDSFSGLVGGSYSIDATNIVLERTLNGIFYSNAFDEIGTMVAPYNRGTILITYEA